MKASAALVTMIGSPHLNEDMLAGRAGTQLCLATASGDYTL
jgi:hypothetical protein